MIAEITDSPLGADPLDTPTFDAMVKAVMQANSAYWKAQLAAMDEKIIKAALGKNED